MIVMGVVLSKGNMGEGTIYKRNLLKIRIKISKVRRTN
jgi:hypothetical protein